MSVCRDTIDQWKQQVFNVGTMQFLGNDDGIVMVQAHELCMRHLLQVLAVLYSPHPHFNDQDQRSLQF